MAPTNQIVWGKEFTTYTPARTQPSAPAEDTSSRVTENATTPSNAITINSQLVNIYFSQQPGGFPTGTMTHYPQAPASSPSAARSITAAEEPTVNEPAAEEPTVDEPAAEEPATGGESETIDKLNAVCSSCQEEKENMRTVKQVGYVCGDCLSYNASRA